MSDKLSLSYDDLYFGITFFDTGYLADTSIYAQSVQLLTED